MSPSRSNSVGEVKNTPPAGNNGKTGNEAHQVGNMEKGDMTAEERSEDKLGDDNHIDSEEALELQRQLAANAQVGWKPSTPDEIRMNKKLNLKFDLMQQLVTDFYPRYDCGFRMALFFGMMAVAGSFGGLIAFGILHAHGALFNWQYLFILEGCVPILLAIICPFLLAREPQTAWYLDDEQRAFAQRRMAADSASNIEGQRRVSRRDFYEALSDWKVWTTMLSNLLASLSSQGFSIFFPVVVKGLGYTSGAKANLMTVPPYVVGAIGVWVVAWSSDRLHERVYHILGGLTVVILGFVLTIVIPLDNTSARYGALIVLQAGAFCQSPLVVAWLAGNTPSPGKRSVVMGISGYANVAGTIGSQLFKPKYGPDYHTPLTITACLLAVGWLGFAGTALALRLINRYRAKKLALMTPEEIDEENRSTKRVGDKKLTFIYGL